MRYSLLAVALLGCAGNMAHAQDTLFAQDQNGTVYRFAWPSGTLLGTLPGSSDVQDMAQGEDGTLYQANQAAGVIHKVNVETGAGMGNAASGIVGAYFGVLYRPNGELIVNGAFDGVLMRFNPANGQFLGWFTTPGNGGLSSTRGMNFGLDGDVYVGGGGSRAYRYNGTTGAFVRSIQFPVGPDRVAIGPDGLLYASNESGQIYRANPDTGQYLGIFVNSSQGMFPVRGIQFGPDGKLYAAAMSHAFIYRINNFGIVDGFFAAGPPLTGLKSILFGNSARSASGRLRLRNRDASAPAINSVQMEWRQPGQSTPISVRTVAVTGSNLNFTIPAPRPAGVYDLSVKVGTWLRRTLQVNVTTASATGLVFDCPNGDCNGDNEVGAADFSILAAAYDTLMGQPAYRANADLDGDGEVGAIDFSILAAYYDQVGDQ